MATADRDARLDQLVAAVHSWANIQRLALQNRVASNKAILKGRTGQERLAQSSVQAATGLVGAQINDFLTT